MVGLIGWGRFYKYDGEGRIIKDGNGNPVRITVPAPPTDPGSPWLADMIRSKAAEIGSIVDVFQWPPTSKVQGGSGEGCDGYGVFCRWDLGTKSQQGSVETRYGSLESLMAAVAALNAHGVRSYGDLVLHQLIGENGGSGVFEYLGADGITMNGRGHANPGWFRGGTGNNDPIPPFCPEDDVPNVASDTPFGREVSYQNSRPYGVTLKDAKEFVVWVTQRVGFQGYRFDDVKGTWIHAVREIMSDDPGIDFYSEYFDGDPANLNWWANQMYGRSAVEDFTLHFRIQAACNSFDASELLNGGGGYWQWSSDLAVGFVDNPDTDLQSGEEVIFNKGLAYAYLLTIPAHLAFIYGKDYYPSSVWPGSYGLKPLIDNLAWISRTFALGGCQIRFLDNKVLVLSRDGNGGPIGWSGGLLTALNFDTLASRTITCSTPFGGHRQLHDYTGHHGDIWTDDAGNATFTIPSNAYAKGESFLCLAPAGVDGPVATNRRTTTQWFIADPTLDVLPVKNGLQYLPQRLCCAKDSTIHATFTFERAGLPAAADVQLSIVDKNGENLASKSTGNKKSASVNARTKDDGWYNVALLGEELPAAGVNFTVKVTYLGTQK